MKKSAFLYSLLLAVATAQAGNHTQYVNPFIGTGAVENSLSGNCYPGATMPFGMVQLSPNTRQEPSWDCAPGYDYNDRTIYGFSHTHLSGTGVSDLIDLMLMPTSDLSSYHPKSAFNHQNEEAHPGYYQVGLTDDGINVQLSATTRCGIHHYSFRKGKAQRIIVDLDHSSKKGDWGRQVIQAQIKIVSPTVVEGYRIITGWAKLRKIYFHMEFSKPIVGHELRDGDRTVHNAPVVNGGHLLSVLDFDAKSGQEITVKVALSPVSVVNARENMRAEAASWDIDNYRQSADRIWESYLKRIDVSGKAEDKQIFYTALYHTLIQPNTMSDVNGEFMGTDYTVKKMPKGSDYYSTFSIWDTYRAAHPLYNLIVPEKNADFIESMLSHYDAYGYLPIWTLWGQENYCMIGNHAIPILVDAALRGTTKLDCKRLLEACVASATRSHTNAPFEVWEKYHYMPENLQTQSVSITLEQAFDDWCIAELAKAMGETEICERFTKRSQYYRSLFNPENGFFQARDDKGNFMTPFDPLKYGANGGNPYTEGNAWQWLWYVPHDVEGLKSLLGGDKSFEKKLDQFFTITDQSGEKNSNASGFVGQYIHGNEPGHHAAYLYNYCGQPRKTQQYVDRIIHEFYNTSSSGYAGNDDCGEMSSWYIFSSMGFYPVNPANGEYAIGTPVFDRVTMTLANGKTFTVEAKRKNEKDIYVKSVSIDGKRLTTPILRYDDIMKGSTLTFQLGK